MHDASGTSGFDDGDDIETDTFLWIVGLKQMRSCADDPPLFGKVNGIFRVTKFDGFSGFHFDGDEAANRVSGHQVNFTFPCAEVAVQYLITHFLQEGFCCFLASSTELNGIHAAIKGRFAIGFVR